MKCVNDGYLFEKQRKELYPPQIRLKNETMEHTTVTFLYVNSAKIPSKSFYSW